jgi:hypothetical protein
MISLAQQMKESIERKSKRVILLLNNIKEVFLFESIYLNSIIIYVQPCFLF